MEKTNMDTAMQAAGSRSWEQLYVLASHWKTDLEFYEGDLNFLYHLVDKYMLWITRQENMEIVKEINFHIRALKNQCRQLEEEVGRHRNELGKLVENPESSGGSKVLKEHARLEEEFARFVNEFRQNRKETFKITEYVIDSEALPSILER